VATVCSYCISYGVCKVLSVTLPDKRGISRHRSEYFMQTVKPDQKYPNATPGVFARRKRHGMTLVLIFEKVHQIVLNELLGSTPQVRNAVTSIHKA
jgi:hypothetical protein